MTEQQLTVQQEQFNKGLQLMALQEASDRIEDAKKDMQSKIEIVNDIDTLRTRLSALETDVEELNEEEMATLFDGIEFHEGYKADLKFKLSYLQLVITTDKAVEEMAHQDNELKKSLDEFKAEMSESLGDSTSEIEFFYKGVRDALELSEKPESKQRFQGLLHSLDESFDHTDLIEALTKSKPANFFYDYTRNERQVAVFERYQKVAKKLRIKSDILSFRTVLESKLPNAELYKDFPNIFVFAVIRFVSYQKDPQPALGLYIARTVSNIQKYSAGRLEGEYKERFEKGVTSVIDALIKSK